MTLSQAVEETGLPWITRMAVALEEAAAWAALAGETPPDPIAHR